MPLPLFIGVTGGEIGVYLYALVARKKEWKIEPAGRFSSGWWLYAISELLIWLLIWRCRLVRPLPVAVC